MLKSLKDRLRESNITAEFSESAVTQIAKAGFDPIYGARPLRRSIQSQIEDLFANEMLDGKVSDGDAVTVVFDDKFKIEKAQK